MSNIFVEKPFQQGFKTHFNEETGVSTVTYINKFGKFVGTAKLHPNDKQSKFSGYHIAESRADIQYYHTMMEYWKGRLDGIRHLFSEIEFVNHGIEDNTVDAFINTMRQAEQQLEYYREAKQKEIKYLKAYLDKIDKNQDNF